MNKAHEVINCFSVDAEGFIESNLQSISLAGKYVSDEKERYEVERNIDETLQFLDEMSVTATFFYLGRIGREIPDVVRKTAEQGHEIACHSNEHLRIYGQTEQDFKEGLISAKETLEDISGREVIGFRAPDFSITQDSLWAFDILREAGFLYDSSVCPTGVHDVYGIEGADPYIHKLDNGLTEFPVSTINIMGKRIPFGGGGYFRLYPVFLSRHFTRRVNGKGHPCMLYMHPYEIGTIIPEIGGISAYRKFRHYYNCCSGIDRLRDMFRSFRFGTAVEILRKRGYIQ